jgi:hypothetical protein
VHLRPLFRFEAILLLAGLCPLLSGCVGVGWAYPTASFIPGVDLGESPHDVRAFRVDVKDDTCRSDTGAPGGEEADRYVMGEITLRFGDRLCPQGKLAVDYGWQSIGPPPAREQNTHYLLLIRLYRSGYRTVEIPAWELASNPRWQAISTLAEQERAVDDLVSTFARDDHAHSKPRKSGETQPGARAEPPPRDSSLFARLAPGSAGKDHRAALLFAASEYELLSGARAGDPDRGVAERAAEKATALRKLADK